MSDEISVPLQRNIPRSRNWSAQADNAKMKSSDRLELQEFNQVVQVMAKLWTKLSAKVMQLGFFENYPRLGEGMGKCMTITVDSHFLAC